MIFRRLDYTTQMLWKNRGKTLGSTLDIWNPIHRPMNDRFLLQDTLAWKTAAHRTILLQTDTAFLASENRWKK